MTTPEGKIEMHLIRRVRETGGHTRKLKWIGRNGAPDRMVWWQFHKNLYADILFVEVKRPGEHPTSQQEEEHKKMRESGLRVFVVSTIQEVEEFVHRQKL